MAWTQALELTDRDHEDHVIQLAAPTWNALELKLRPYRRVAACNDDTCACLNMYQPRVDRADAALAWATKQIDAVTAWAAGHLTALRDRRDRRAAKRFLRHRTDKDLRGYGLAGCQIAYLRATA